MAKHLLTAAEIEAEKTAGAHPWNDNSSFRSTQLSRSLGMERSIVVHVAIPPGKESFVPHTHEREEEWVYILAGSGTADIDGEEVAVSGGDFLGFSTPSVVHHLRNTGDSELVYLMGGECHYAEASNFPTLNKRKIRLGNEVHVFDLDKPEKEV
ncbi:MAG: cupin domain-containing protein [Gammaproteobacteria bacterium]|nr:cupin domain-containing protein [Gammaproteobacteria bacterium]